MPWKPKDAKRHTDKAKGKKLSRVWAQVANDSLERELDHGTPQDKAEAIAIRSANSVLGRVKGKGKKAAAVDAQTMGHSGSVGAGDGPVFAGAALDSPVKAEAGDQANLVMNEFLPKIGEHWARVAEPETFNHETFRAADVQAGVRCIEGQLKDGYATRRTPARARRPACRRGPRACHSSSAMCGANGESSSTNFSIAARGRALVLEEEVGELHHPRDGRVERHLLDVAGHGLDRLVQHAVLLGRGLDVLRRPR